MVSTTTQKTIIRGPFTIRHEFKPQLSRSGKLLAYARRNSPAVTELRIRDLQSGTDRKLTILTNADDPDRAFELNDEIPAYAFTPDERFVVIWYGGKLHKVAVADGADQLIPVRVHVSREVSVPIRAHYRISDEPAEVRAIRWPVVTNDRRKLIFSAIGYLWKVDLPDGRPERLTQSEDFEYSPALSPDGERIAYVAFAPAADKIGVGRGRLMVLRLGDAYPQEILPADDVS